MTTLRYGYNKGRQHPTNSRSRLNRLLALIGCLTFPLALTACGAGEPRAGTGGWAGTIDTLANGAIHIQNPATGIWDESDGWRLEEDLRIGTVDRTGPDLFGEITDIAADGYGRIYILEGQTQEIRVFNPDGTHLRTIGRRGGGPGEFQRAGALRWGPEGDLWVVDVGNGRYSAFDTTGAYLTMVRRPTGIRSLPWPGAIHANGDLTEVAIDPATEFELYPALILVTYRIAGRDLIPLDTIRLPEYDAPYFEHLTANSHLQAYIPFAPRLLWRYDPRGFIRSGVSGRYRIVRQNTPGDTVQIVDLPFRPLPVTEEERAEAIEHLEWFTNEGGKYDASRIPRTQPVFQNFFTDPDGYLWVQPATTTAERGRRFDLFDPEGRYLGRINADFPTASTAPLVIGDYFYTVTQDEFDIPYLVRARIVKTGSGADDITAG